MRFLLTTTFHIFAFILHNKLFFDIWTENTQYLMYVAKGKRILWIIKFLFIYKCRCLFIHSGTIGRQNIYSFNLCVVSSESSEFCKIDSYRQYIHDFVAYYFTSIYVGKSVKICFLRIFFYKLVTVSIDLIIHCI